MTIIGFNYKEIKVKKKQNATGKVNITNNIAIKEVTKEELKIGQTAKEGLKFKFEFKSMYEPDAAEIIILGDLISIESEEKVTSVLDQWKKDKKVDDEIMPVVLNYIFAKCVVESVLYSKSIGLPPPLPLPKVVQKKVEQA
jgi:hypothetical protein